MPLTNYRFRWLRLIVSILVTLALLSSPLSGPVGASPEGDVLKPTFDTGGKLLTDFGNSDDLAEAVAIQPDGKIVVAGLSAVNGGDYSMALARYSSDGSLDPAFGTYGMATSLIGGSASAMVLQPDGKILIAGSSAVGFMVARFNSNGSPDASFGTNGVVNTNLSDSGPMDYDYAFSIALQPDGKIVAAGASYTGNSADFGLVRYTTNGTLDSTFDGDGKIVTDFGESEGGTSVVLQPDGKIVMAGSDQIGNFVLARYNTNGSLDATFDGDGKLISNLGTSASASQIAIQANGRLVVAGFTSGPDYNFILARYNTNGSMDATFDGDGNVITDFGNGDLARALTIQPDGRIVVIGSTGNISNNYTFDLAMARYNTNGALDTTFDGDGKVTVAVGCSGDENKAVALQSDGKIVVAGTSSNCLNYDVAVTRFHTNGSLDSSFHQDGKVTTDFGGGTGYEWAHAVALQADGKILAVGHHHHDSYRSNFALARYNPNGSLDNTFGTRGKVTTDFGLRVQDAGYNNFGQAVVLQMDGKILVGGSSGNGGGTSRMALARYNPNGSLDLTFSTDGKVTTDYGQGWAMALQPDGKIILAGDSGYPNNTSADPVSFMLARFNANGSPDTTFDGDGKLTTFFGLNVYASIQAVAVQPNGKIIVAGFVHRGSYSDFALARYNSNGSLDTTFDGDGIVITTFGASTSYSFGRDLVLQPDGKIVVSGSTHAGPEIGIYANFALARYNSNGSLDPTFDSDGRVVTDLSNERDDIGWAVSLQQDGKIVVGGSTSSNFAVARYNPNGSLDPTFHGNGKAVLENFGSNSDVDMTLQPDGRIIMAGGSWHDTNYDNYDFALARMNDITLPGVFNKITPVHGASNQANSLTLSWEASAGATAYQFCFDTTNDNACTNWTNNGMSTSKILSGLSLQTTFYWQVRAVNGGGITYANASPTAFWSFRTLDPPGAFGKVAPANSSPNVNLSTTLSWSSSPYASSYQYCYDLIDDDQCNHTWSHTSSTSVQISNLGTSTTYYWQVRALNKAGITDADDQSWYSWTTSSTLPGGSTEVEIFVGTDKLGRYSLKPVQSLHESYIGQNNGPVKISNVNLASFIAAERVIYKGGSVPTSFSEMMAVPNGQLDNIYWFPWYNNKDLDTQLRIANVSGSTATVQVYIDGDEMQGSPFTLLAGESTRKSFPGINNGPVKIVSDEKIVAAERVIYKVNNVGTSFTETMGLPNHQLDTTYWLPWYNNKDLDTQLRFANVTEQTATVHISIGGVEMTGSPFTLLAGESTRKSFPGINNGPVKIESDVPIVAAERVIYKINNVGTSFSEIMALPNKQLDTTYWLPWYNNKDLDTQLRFANVTDQPATVYVYVGGMEVAGSPFTLLAGESTRKSFPELSYGPVQIVSSVNIVAAERVILKVNGTPTSFSEMMGLPAHLLDTTYWFPWYNNVELDTQLRFGMP